MEPEPQVIPSPTPPPAEVTSPPSSFLTKPIKKPTISLSSQSIALAILCMVISSTIVYEYELRVQHTIENTYRQDLVAVQSQLNKDEIVIFARQHKQSSAKWLNFSSGSFSYEFPSTGVITNQNLGSFSSDGLIYGVQVFTTVASTTISQWMVQNTVKNAAQYTPATVNNHTAYRSPTELATYLLAGDKVYFIYAKDGAHLSQLTADESYAHILTTFKIGR